MDEDQFSLVSVGGGAILFDRKSASVFELNETATFVWSRRLKGDSPEAIGAALAQRYSLSPQSALDDVHTAFSLRTVESIEEQGDFRYLKGKGGYSFIYHGDLIFEVDNSGSRIRLASGFDGSRQMLGAFLRALTPKIVAMRGGTVIHASAVEVRGSVVAFSGLSGAGKTTTARMAADAGARLVAEDQVLLRAAGGSVGVASSAEQLITSWVQAAADALLMDGEVSCDGLDTAGQCESLPLVEIGFVDLSRRIGAEYGSRQLKSWETAAQMFKNGFYGSDRHDDWNRHLEAAAQLGSSVSGFLLTLPDGLDRLAEAMKKVTAMATLRA